MFLDENLHVAFKKKIIITKYLRAYESLEKSDSSDAKKISLLLTKNPMSFLFIKLLIPFIRLVRKDCQSG